MQAAVKHLLALLVQRGTHWHTSQSSPSEQTPGWSWRSLEHRQEQTQTLLKVTVSFPLSECHTGITRSPFTNFISWDTSWWDFAIIKWVRGPKNFLSALAVCTPWGGGLVGWDWDLGRGRGLLSLVIREEPFPFEQLFAGVRTSTSNWLQLTLLLLCVWTEIHRIKMTVHICYIYIMSNWAEFWFSP